MSGARVKIVFVTMDDTTRLPPPHFDSSAAAGPQLPICQIQYETVSTYIILQLASITGGTSPIRQLGLRVVACSWPHHIADGCL